MSLAQNNLAFSLCFNIQPVMRNHSFLEQYLPRTIVVLMRNLSDPYLYLQLLEIFHADQKLVVFQLNFVQLLVNLFIPFMFHPELPQFSYGRNSLLSIISYFYDQIFIIFFIANFVKTRKGKTMLVKKIYIIFTLLKIFFKIVER